MTLCQLDLTAVHDWMAATVTTILNCKVAGYGDWGKLFTPFLSPLLVIVGWWLVNKQNNKRERRKELRQLIDRSQKIITEVVDTGAKYHSGHFTEDKSSTVAGWKLIMGITQISSHIHLLKRNGLVVHAADEYISLKKALTGGDFMTKDWKPWGTEDQRWNEVNNAANRLVHALDAVFFESFNN